PIVFDAIFSVVINSEKLGILTLKSIIFITILASMVAILPDSSETKRDEKNPVGKNEHTVGFISTVGASASYALLLGVVGLIYLVSSLFSNVVSMLSLPFVPVVGVLFYKEKMDANKVLAMLFTLWGFASYIYQQYLDDNNSQKKEYGQNNGHIFHYLGLWFISRNPGDQRFL
ncbi:hypothetical protein Gotri_019687, partial [Gossypium trilobum]|nr:hypothetical protein [Gossypium trilobum]